MFGIQTHKEISQDYLSDFNYLKVTLLVVWDTHKEISQDYLSDFNSLKVTLLVVWDTDTQRDKSRLPK